MHPDLPPARPLQRGLARIACALLGLLLRRIWLPPRLYAAVPWLYLGTGSAALAGGLYLPDDSWYLPYLALSGLGLLRLAVTVAGLRQKWQARWRQSSTA